MNLPLRAYTQTLVADTIIVNATVHTMDPTRPNAEAMAILGNRIVAVGSTKEINKLSGSKTRTIDAKKRLVLPGFNEDRKSTRLNSSHSQISYAVFCLKK